MSDTENAIVESFTKDDGAFFLYADAMDVVGRTEEIRSSSGADGYEDAVNDLTAEVKTAVAKFVVQVAFGHMRELGYRIVKKDEAQA